jgi:hypothetical protein
VETVSSSSASGACHISARDRKVDASVDRSYRSLVAYVFIRDAPYSSEAPSLSISRAMVFHRLSFFDETVEPVEPVFEPVAPARVSASSAGGVTRDRASCCLSFGTDVGGSALGGAFDVRRVFRVSKHGVLEDGKVWRPGARGFGDREATPPLGRAEADASAADMAVRGGTAGPAARTRVKPRESPTCFSRRNSQRVSGVPES